MSSAWDRGGVRRPTSISSARPPRGPWSMPAGRRTAGSGIVLTHVHPDHSGSARELARAWNCPVYVHPDELGQANGDFDALRAGAGPVDLWLVLPLLRALGQRRREAIL